jgi:hypothetical protein
MADRRPTQEDEIESLLDKLCGMREELLSIERSLERIQASAKEREQQKDRTGKSPR